MQTIGVIFMVFPFILMLIGGIAILSLSKKLKKNSGKKKGFPAIYAKIIDIQTEDYRDDYGYLINRQYNITVEYEKNGELKIRTIRSFYDYPTGIEVEIKETGAIHGAYIVDTPTQGIKTRNTNTATFVKGYQILKVLGIIMIVIPCLMFIAQIPFLQNILGVILGLGFASIPAIIGTILYMKSKKKEADFNNGVYEKFNAKIIDVKKESSDNNTRYCPIVEIDYYGTIYTPQLWGMGTKITEIGNIIPVYIHKKTQDMLTDNEIKSTNFGVYFLFGISAFIWLIMLFTL